MCFVCWVNGIYQLRLLACECVLNMCFIEANRRLSVFRGRLALHASILMCMVRVKSILLIDCEVYVAWGERFELYFKLTAFTLLAQNAAQ